MSKIKKIKVKNFKAISDFEGDFNGCTCIVTAGNNKGKSTLLTGLIDRIRGEKPELILKNGEKDGFAIMELTTGDRFEWIFTDKKEILNFYSKGTKFDVSKGSTLKGIQSQYFPVKFDVDNFINSQPKHQNLTLQKLVGIDFDEIDAKYKQAFDLRTESNRELKRIESIQLVPPSKVDEPENIENLEKEKNAIRSKMAVIYRQNQANNKELREKWQSDNNSERQVISDFNEYQHKKNIIIENFEKELEQIKLIISNFKDYFDFEAAYLAINQLPKAEPLKTFIPSEEPSYINEMPDNIDLLAIDEKIKIANEKRTEYELYIVEINRINKHNSDLSAAKQSWNDLDEKVKSIESEKRKIIESANLPDGITFVDGGILIDGLPFETNQISTSKKYITALKLASLCVGEVEMIHFDCSTLDRKSFNEVLDFAKLKGLQLLIERPDWNEGELKIEIISE